MLSKLFDSKTLFRKLCNPIRFRLSEFVELLKSNPESRNGIGSSPVPNEGYPEGAGSNPVALFQLFQSTSLDNKRLHYYATG